MRRWRSRQGSVAVEFALVSVFFLLPLVLGLADGLVMLTAQAQLNTALQALYYYAMTDPADSQNSTSSTTYDEELQVIALINKNSMFPISLTSYPLNKTPTSYSIVYYGCAPASPPQTPSTTDTDCATETPPLTQQIFVQYTVTTPVTLPIPIPGVSNPMTMSASGMVQVW